MTTHWHRRHISALQNTGIASLPVTEPADVVRISDDRYYWDQCPVLDDKGDNAKYQDAELWVALSAPAIEPATARHNQARLRLLMRKNQQWVDCGNLLPDGFCQGSCEWAGMARVDDAGLMTLYYTAKGTKGEQEPSYRQRIFQASATLISGEPMPKIENWTDHGEPVRADGNRYQVADQIHGDPGSVRAFRDPFYFVNTTSGKEYLLFSASGAKATAEQNAVIGIAVKKSASGNWELQDPVIDGDGLTNEMERPHVIHFDGGYYLFWSVHGWTFANGVNAPTGLYGMVANSVQGAYEPINGTGLIAANPIERPYQAYSWFVSSDLSVSSFVDMYDGRIGKEPDSPRYPLGTFQGTIAPEFHLRLDGPTAWVATENEADTS